MEQIAQRLRPDSKGRITLGKLAQGVSSFRALRTDEGHIVLEPYVEVPASERWLYENAEAMDSVRAGLADAAAGRTVSRGSFANFADDDED